MYRNVERIVREEMDAAGFQEVHFPALLPKAPYEASNRWLEYGDGMFRLKDRRGNDFLLAPTHEEMFTLLVKDLYSSYQDLPLVIYQIQTKYRDEPRPRAGLLRGREFVMKDSYSFDIDDAGLEISYQRHRDAYIKTFERLGMPFVIVSAMSGAMGGSASEEFLAPIPTGEDTFVRCPSCGYAANVEAVRISPPADQPVDGLPAGRRSRHSGHADDRHARRPPQRPCRASPATTVVPWTAADTLKNVVVMIRHPDGTREPLAIGVPGDRDVDVKRLEAALLPAEPEAFTDEDFARYPMLAKGYIGPGALGESSPSGIRFLVDPRVVTGTAWVTGADQRRPPCDRARRRPRLHRRRNDRRRQRRRRAIRARRAARPWRRPVASRSATSSNSDGATPRPSTSRCSTPTARRSPSRWAPTESACPGPWPPSPS